MKRLLLILTLLALLSACAPAQTPQPTLDVAATIESLSGTMTAGTLTALPTATTQPSSTPELPTATLTLPTETSTPTLEPTATLTPEPFFGTLDPLGAGDYKTGLFLIENNSGEAFIIVNISGTTNQGNPKPWYYTDKITSTTLFNIPWGDYSYSVQIGTKKTLSGSFIIRNKDKTTMRVSKDKVIVVGP
jgi:hypothetical protein